MRYLSNKLWQGLALLLMAVMVSLAGAPLSPLFGSVLIAGATATYNPTKTTDVPKLWRKVQGNLVPGFKFMCEEWMMLEDLEEYDVDWSTREITTPIDLNEGYGVSSIPEGGFESRPSSPAPEEISLTWIMLNKRFTATKTARYIDERSREAMIKRQLLYQGRKAIEDIGRQFSDYFYGFSTATLAQTSTVATQASGTYTLKNLYGSTSVDGSTTLGKVQLAQKFQVGDYVALIRAGALVTNAIGLVTAKSATTPSLTITWAGSVTSANNDNIVKANSMENTTIAGTDLNLGLAGVFDAMTSTSLHGLSGASVGNWNVAFSDTTGGRFSGMRLHRAADEIANKGGGTLNLVLMAQGVKRDAIALERAALRFSDPYALEIDGDIKSKGRQFKTSQRVPAGCVFAGDKKSLSRMTLLPKPSEKPVWGDGKPLQDQSAYVFSLDFPCQLVWTSRANWAYWTTLTEQ